MSNTTKMQTTANTKIKRPYWAGAGDVQPTTTQAPAAPMVPRKPLGASVRHSPSKRSSPPRARSIARKPVPAAPAAEPAWEYNPVEGNPYLPHDQQCPMERRPISRRDSSPPYISTEEANNLHQPGLQGWCYERLKAHDNAQPPEPILSPGDVSNNGKSLSRSGSMAKASKVLSRGIGSIRKASLQAKRALSISQEPKISSPVPGSFRRTHYDGHVLESQDDVEPFELVELDVAQADVRRYGQADHELAATRAADPRADAMSKLTGEPVPPPPARNPSRIQRKPAPTVNTPSTKPQPSADPAYAPAPAAVRPKLTTSPSCKIVGDADRETLFGDIIDAAQDSSWVDKPENQIQPKTDANSQSQGSSRGKGRVSVSRAPAPMPASFRREPAAGNPFTRRIDSFAALVPKPPQDLHKTLPPVPGPDSPRRDTVPMFPSEHDPNRATKASLAETLASQGVRRTSYVPGIKCADCGKMIDAIAVSDHRCGKRAVQAVDSESQPTGLTREDIYAANFRRSPHKKPSLQSLINESQMRMSHEPGVPDVIVDTFVRDGHTSWVGVVRTEGSQEALGGQIDGGADGIQQSNRSDDAADYYRKIAGID